MEALVSVIIPVKNRSDELKRALNSVINQTYQTFEVLVVDDRSQEDIQGVINSIGDHRISYHLNTSDVSNANVCRNIGLKHAKGEFVAMLDSDDEWFPNHLDSKLQFLKVNICDGVFGSAYVDDGVKRTLRLSRHIIDHESMLDYLLTTGRAPTPTHFYKAKCAKQIGWDEELFRHQDFDFSARFAEMYKFIPCEEPTVIIHWKKGEAREEHNMSLRIFLEKNQKRMSVVNLVKYSTEMYASMERRNVQDKNILSFYRKMALKHIRFMSFADYSLLYPSTNKVSAVIKRILYSLRILTN